MGTPVGPIESLSLVTSIGAKLISMAIQRWLSSGG
jgi:hypothetical protein